MRPWTPPLVDLYELTMTQAYLEHAMLDESSFSLFFRTLPDRRNYLLSCGVGAMLDHLESLRFDAETLAFLADQGTFSDPFLSYLEGFRFVGDVHAVPDGTPVFPDEPLVEVSAPLPQAQIVETLVMNQMHLHTVLASKASRVVMAAEGRKVVDFGARRSHGIDASLAVGRACFVAGIDATSNVASGMLDGVPVAGTMAHSYVQAHDDEAEAFRRWAATFPDSVLLVDTFDTLAGVREVVRLSRELGADFRLRAIRLDSGSLGELAQQARQLLDDGGLEQVSIFASGGLDERSIARLLADGAPIDGFGVGTSIGAAADAPSLDMAYKLVEYARRGRMKLSSGKATLPGRKQIFRRVQQGTMVGDTIARADEELPGFPLLRPVMQRGERLVAGREPLVAARQRAAQARQSLPSALLELDPAARPYPVAVSSALRDERHVVAARAEQAGAQGGD